MARKNQIATTAIKAISPAQTTTVKCSKSMVCAIVFGRYDEGIEWPVRPCLSPVQGQRGTALQATSPKASRFVSAFVDIFPYFVGSIAYLICSIYAFIKIHIQISIP